MKRKGLILIICLFISGLTMGVLNNQGDISHVERIISASSQSDEESIQDAMDVVAAYFKKEFDGCTLLTLEYSDLKQTEAEEWKRQYNAKEVIVLTSTFEVGDSGGDGSLNPNSLYTKWKWILCRNSYQKWQLKTWGY